MTTHHPAPPPHLARLAGWRAAVLWLLLALPVAQAWLIRHEYSHWLPDGHGAQLQTSPRTAQTLTRSDLADAHSTCLLCLAGGALAHAAGPTAPLTGWAAAPHQRHEPAAIISRWTPPAPRHYASRAPPLKD